MKPFPWLLLVLLVSGCAGSPRYIANASNSRPINVDGQSFYVLNEGGVWMATYQDIIAKGFFPTEADIFRQKIGLTRAIEAASGCKVSSSSQEPSLCSAARPNRRRANAAHSPCSKRSAGSHYAYKRQLFGCSASPVARLC
jgi:hypothetical protein